jgi:hypothetical protein
VAFIGEFKGLPNWGQLMTKFWQFLESLFPQNIGDFLESQCYDYFRVQNEPNSPFFAIFCEKNITKILTLTSVTCV